MNKNKILIEINFTFINYIKSVSFRLVAVLGIAMIFLSFNMTTITKLFIPDDKIYNFYVSVESDSLYKELEKGISDDKKINLIKINVNEVDKYIEKLNNYDENISGVLNVWLKDQQINFHYLSSIPKEKLVYLNSSIENMAFIMKYDKAKLSVAEINILSKEIVNYVTYDSVEKASYFILILNIFFFIILITYVTSLGNGVIEEKTNRITETLLTYISPLEMMLGKLLGIFLGLILHLILFSVTYLIGSYIFNKNDYLFVQLAQIFNGKIIFAIIIILILGYFSYGFLYLGNSAFANNIQDSDQASIVQSIIILVSFYSSFVLYMHFDITIARIFIAIPFINVFASPIYIATLNANWSEIITIICIQIFYTILLSIICSKLFKIGITNYEKRKLFFNSRK